MKRTILGFEFLLLMITDSQAFESGSYKCTMMGMEVTYVLKANGRAKAISAYGTERGNWQDDDDAAIIIKNDQILEDKGNGKYVFGGMFPCVKIK